MGRFVGFFLLLMLLACSSPEGGDGTTTNQTLLSPEHQSWLAALQEDEAAQAAPAAYGATGVVFAEGQVYQGSEAIAGYWASAPKPQRFDNEFLLEHDADHYFELGHYQFADAATPPLAAMLAWEKVDGEWQRAIEILYPHTFTEKGDRTPIDEARDQWIELSNGMDVGYLVRTSYTPNAYYVNQGKVVQGTQAITQAYSYMGQTGWQIMLAPHQMKQVQDNLYYEIGQYRSNGIGHYILLWEKQPSGQWQVLLDFNF